MTSEVKSPKKIVTYFDVVDTLFEATDCLANSDNFVRGEVIKQGDKYNVTWIETCN